MTIPKSPPFYTYLREERQFSFLLAHLLMQKGDALARFIDLIREREPGIPPIEPLNLEEAEVYVEFAQLRDYWDSLARDESGSLATKAQANAKKRDFVLRLFQTVPNLRFLAHDDLPLDPEEFNAHFMGQAGSRIAKDVASPGLWSVKSLSDQFAGTPDVFLDLCRLKWSFNIKPDVVIRIPGLPTLCIEAKLESGEGVYPTARPEIALVESAGGVGKRVRQFELQQFLFEQLLGEPCVPVVVQKLSSDSAEGCVVTWGEVMRSIADPEQADNSIPFVRYLIDKNRFLKASPANKS